MRKSKPETRSLAGRFLASAAGPLMLLAFCCWRSATAAQSSGASQGKPPGESAPAAAKPENEEAAPAGDWAAEFLDIILSSPNEEAQDALYRAAFAAGPGIIPRLADALKDDRTAEYAAQSLAFLGGERALEILAPLVADPRDLDLRRFYYGALGEYDSPQAVDLLLDVINKSDAEPDRTVTEAAILALTVRSDAALVPRLRQAETKLQDVVIRDDLDNALDIIESRAHYLASPEGKTAGGSVEEAVRTYFAPALEPPPLDTSPPTSRNAAQKSPAPSRPQRKPLVTVDVRKLTLSPDKTRALALVMFEDPEAAAEYHLVLRKRAGNWVVASVWLGKESEKPKPVPTPHPTSEH